MKKRKLTRKGMKKKIDEKFKQKMRKTKPFVCCTCLYWGRTPVTHNLHWGHLITATLLGTRWDDYNVNWQCNPCNMMHEYHPEKYTLWFINNYGYKEYKELEKRSRIKIPNYDIFYKNKLAEFSKKI